MHQESLRWMTCLLNNNCSLTNKDSKGLNPSLYRESDGASTAGQVDEEEMSALIDEIHSQKGSGQSEAIQLAERLLHGEGEHSPKLKALPHSSYSHLLLSLAEKGRKL